MKCVETFKSRQEAVERQKLLAERRISAKVWVDPLESMYPALSDYHDVSLMVANEVGDQAEKILKTYKKTG